MTLRNDLKNTKVKVAGKAVITNSGVVRLPVDSDAELDLLTITNMIESAEAQIEALNQVVADMKSVAIGFVLTDAAKAKKTRGKK